MRIDGDRPEMPVRLREVVLRPRPHPSPDARERAAADRREDAREERDFSFIDGWHCPGGTMPAMPTSVSSLKRAEHDALREDRGSATVNIRINRRRAPPRRAERRDVQRVVAHAARDDPDRGRQVGCRELAYDDRARTHGCGPPLR